MPCPRISINSTSNFDLLLKRIISLGGSSEHCLHETQLLMGLWRFRPRPHGGVWFPLLPRQSRATLFCRQQCKASAGPRVVTVALATRGKLKKSSPGLLVINISWALITVAILGRQNHSQWRPHKSRLGPEEFGSQNWTWGILGTEGVAV